MKRDRSLKILSAVRNVDDRYSSGFSLPSWVPDWSRDPVLTSLGLSNKFLEPYDAGGSVACGLLIATDDLKLHCLGTSLDSIETLGQTCLVKGPKMEEQIAGIFNHWYDMYSSKLSKYSGRTEIRYRGDMGFWLPYASHKSTDSEMLYSFWNTIHARPSPSLQLTSGEILQSTYLSKWDGMKFCPGRKLLVTKTGFIGLAPPEAKPGDIVAVLIGAPTPHILRKRGNHYKLVGECYIHGIMGGEALGHLNEELKAIGHRCRPCPNSKSNARLETFTIE